MTEAVTFRPLARSDLLQQMFYLSEHAGDETAERYYEAVSATCNLLSDRPLSGALVLTSRPQLEGMRRFPVTRPFEKSILFYKPTLIGVEVYRILHGARDLQAALEEQEPGALP